MVDEERKSDAADDTGCWSRGLALGRMTEGDGWVSQKSKAQKRAGGGANLMYLAVQRQRPKPWAENRILTPPTAKVDVTPVRPEAVGVCCKGQMEQGQRAAVTQA